MNQSSSNPPPLYFDNRSLVFLFSLSSLIFALYYPVMGAGFMSDDQLYISNNDALKNLQLENLLDIIYGSTNTYEYLPLRDLSYWIDIQLFGMDTFGYHAHNIIIYLFCIIAVYTCSHLFFTLFFSKHADFSKRFAYLNCLLFALHPAHIESVAWISGRKELLSGLFSILALLFYLSLLRRDSKPALHFIASFLCYTLAILSKASVIALPIFMALLGFVYYCREHAPRSTALFKSLVTILPFILLAALDYYVIVNLDYEKAPRFDPALAPHSIFERGTERFFLILGTLFRITIWPVNLRLHYDVYASNYLLVTYCCALFISAGAIAGFTLLIKRNAVLLLGPVFFILLALPYLQLAPFLTWSLASERFLFLPLLGITTTLCAALIILKPKVAITIVGILAICFAVLTIDRTKDWRSTESLLKTNIQKTQHFYAKYLYIKIILIPQDKFQEAVDIVNTIDDQQIKQLYTHYIALQKIRAKQRSWMPLDPFVDASSKLQNELKSWTSQPIFYDIPKFAIYSAIVSDINNVYRYTIQLHNDNPHLTYNYALFLSKARLDKEAVTQFTKAIDSNKLPPFLLSKAWNNLGLSHKNLSDFDSAIKAYNQAIQSSQNEWKAAYNLANIYRLLKDEQKLRQSLVIFKTRAASASITTERISQLMAEFD